MNHLKNYMRIASMFLLILLIEIISFKSFAQPINTEVIPPSPTAAELGRYGNTPVSMYTGVPNISVPVYTIQSQDITVPISLSYHAGGIKVEQEASWVGLGWSLNAGGVITKSVRGLDDIESSQGLSQSEIDFLLNNNGDFTGNNLTMILNLCDGTRDGELDIFYYNFMGNAGKFVFNATTSTVYKVAKNDLDIKYVPDGFNSYWAVRAVDGALYEFKDKETTIPQNSTQSNNFISAWHLTKITSSTNRVVNFQYKSASIETLAGFSVVKRTIDPFSTASSACPTAGTTTSASYSRITTLQLEKITFNHGEVLVNSSKKRADLLQNLALEPQGYKIDDIQVKLDGQLIHNITFNHSFFSVPGTAYQVNSDYKLNTTSTADRFLAANHRLKLDGIAIDDKSYFFNYYNPDDLPRKDSKSQDHWGFINDLANATNPNTLLPTEIVRNRCGQNEVIGTSRDANTANSKNGLLSKITYPTGGTTEYTYESNTTSKQRINWVPTTVAALNANSNNAPTEKWIAFRMPSNLECFGLEAVITYENPLDNVSNNNASIEIYEVSQWTTQALSDWELGIRDLTEFTLNDAVSYTSIFETHIGQNTIHEDANLTHGNYYLMRTKALAYNSSAAGTLYGYINGGTESYNDAIGGARIKQVVSYDGVDPENNVIKTYDYAYNGTSLSSGRLVSQPNYDATYVQYDNPNDYGGTINIDGRFSCDQSCTVNESRSYSQPLGSTSGSHIIYKEVTEYAGTPNKNAGYTLNKFSYSSPTVNISFPYTPGSNEDFRNGNLIEQYIYDQAGVLVKELHNTYAEKVTEYSHSIKAFNLFPRHKFEFIIIESCAFQISAYQINSGFNYLQSSEEINYSSGTGPSVTTLTTYFYDKVDALTNNHHQLTRKIQKDSEGNDRVTEYKYVRDYTFLTNSVLDKMSDKNMVGLPLETIQQVGGEEVAAQAVKYVYDDVNDLVLPGKVYSYESMTPGMGFSESTDGETFSGYQLKTELKHDNKGNVLEVLGSDGVFTSYVWGYGQSYPVAKVVNAAYSDIETTLGGVGFALDGGNYLSSQQVDLLKALPMALVTTYTYKPGIGLSTMTDPTGIKQEYSYDTYGRLLYIKDDDDNIINKYEYQYKNSPTN